MFSLRLKEVCLPGHDRLMHELKQHNELPARLASTFTSCSAVVANTLKLRVFPFRQVLQLATVLKEALDLIWMLPICLDARHAYTGSVLVEGNSTASKTQQLTLAACRCKRLFRCYNGSPRR